MTRRAATGCGVGWESAGSSSSRALLAPLAQVLQVELEVGLVQVHRGPVCRILRCEQQHQMNHRTTGECLARGVVVATHKSVGVALPELDAVAADAGILAGHR